MACPTITLTGITTEVWDCCRREARRMGVAFPEGDAGSVRHPEAEADFAWDSVSATLQVTFTRTPSYIRCEMLESRLREGARMCGARG